MDELPVNVFIEARQNALAEIVLDGHTTDLPLHGKQEGRLFHGYYDMSSAANTFCAHG